MVMTLQCMQMWSQYVTPEGNLMLYEELLTLFQRKKKRKEERKKEKE